MTLRLYKGAGLESVVVQPNLAGPSCAVTARLVAGDGGFKGQVAAQVLTDGDHRPVSSIAWKAIEIKPHQVLEVDLKSMHASGAQPWNPTAPTLHHAVVWLIGEDGRSVAAVRDETFGFRKLTWDRGRLLINGRPVPLFGATELVMYRMLELLDDEAQLKKVQVDLFKGMNGIAFRSHQNPLPRRWLDLCDRYGILVLPEFPNFPDVQRPSGASPYEIPDYVKNLQREARGIIAARNHHPSIVGWVVSNEGSGFGDWERNNLVPYVKSLDPGRPVMLSGDITSDIADQHAFAGMWWGTYAEFQRVVLDLARFYPERLLGCSEYGQYGPSKRWYGPREVTGQSPEVEQDLARILMEQTEVLRRARYGLIMPFAYGGNWFGKTADQTGRPADAAPPYQALRNALAPIGLSFEFGRHARAGTTVEIPVWLYSDTNAAAGEVEVTLYLLDRNPGYDWTGNLEGLKVLASGSFSAELPPWQLLHQNVSLYLPAESGAYWLAALARDPKSGSCHAISLKALRLYEPLAKPAKRLTVGVIERDGRMTRWLRSRGHRVVLAYGDIKPDVIVFSEGCLYDERIRTWGASMTGRIEAGTRLVSLEQGNWDTKVMQPDISKVLAGVTAVPQQTSLENLFPVEALSEAVGTAADFQRLNGLDNVAMRVALVATGQTQTSAEAAPARLTPEAAASQPQAAASQPSDWTSLMDGYGLRGDKPGWALATRTFGRGRVLACQVPLLGRVEAANASSSTPADPTAFDPMAERLLAFLVEGKVPAAAPATGTPTTQPAHP